MVNSVYFSQRDVTESFLVLDSLRQAAIDADKRNLAEAIKESLSSGKQENVVRKTRRIAEEQQFNRACSESLQEEINKGKSVIGGLQQENVALLDQVAVQTKKVLVVENELQLKSDEVVFLGQQKEKLGRLMKTNAQEEKQYIDALHTQVIQEQQQVKGLQHELRALTADKNEYIEELDGQLRDVTRRFNEETALRTNIEQQLQNVQQQLGSVQKELRIKTASLEKTKNLLKDTLSNPNIIATRLRSERK